jgi:1,2-diacylglycerol 3-alpha-glucosyltransferase
MRIGLFTDTYHPVVNGITVVVDIIKNNLEQLGHEVYIVAPAASLRFWKFNEKHVLRFPGIQGLFFDEYMSSVFFPHTQYQKIKKLELDAIMIFTPAQVGLMGAYSALKLDIPLVSQYSTDLAEYIERYPTVFPGLIALSASLPFVLNSSTRDVIKTGRQMTKKADTEQSWKAYTLQKSITFLHNHCSAVVSVSVKVADMLEDWQTEVPVHVIPTGVDIGKVDYKKVSDLKIKYGLKNTDKILLSLGRVAKEKNIDLIIDSLPFVLEYEPTAKLVIVGNFNYRETLEKKVLSMGLETSVIFTGKVALKDRWNMYALADVFCFPSVTDTQALVVNEAGLMSLPIVWCDEGVNDVLIDGKTGVKAKNTPSSYAKALLKVLADKNLRIQYGKKANSVATKYTELAQTKKLEKVLKDLVATGTQPTAR